MKAPFVHEFLCLNFCPELIRQAFSCCIFRRTKTTWSQIFSGIQLQFNYFSGLSGSLDITR